MSFALPSNLPAGAYGVRIEVVGDGTSVQSTLWVLPRGTHQWDKFVTPDELEIAMERAGLRTTDERGVIYNFLADRWELSTDMDVNYMVLGEK